MSRGSRNIFTTSFDIDIWMLVIDYTKRKLLVKGEKIVAVSFSSFMCMLAYKLSRDLLPSARRGKRKSQVVKHSNCFPDSAFCFFLARSIAFVRFFHHIHSVMMIFTLRLLLLFTSGRARWVAGGKFVKKIDTDIQTHTKIPTLFSRLMWFVLFKKRNERELQLESQRKRMLQMKNLLAKHQKERTKDDPVWFVFVIKSSLIIHLIHALSFYIIKRGRKMKLRYRFSCEKQNIWRYHKSACDKNQNSLIAAILVGAKERNSREPKTTCWNL